MRRAERSAPRRSCCSALCPRAFSLFCPLGRALSEKYDLLAHRSAGFGASAGRADVLAPQAMGDFIAKAVDHFELERPHAVGPDIGTSSLLFDGGKPSRRLASITIGSGGAAFPLEVESTLKDIIDLPSTEPLLQMPWQRSSIRSWHSTELPSAGVRPRRLCAVVQRVALRRIHSAGSCVPARSRAACRSVVGHQNAGADHPGQA